MRRNQWKCRRCGGINSTHHHMCAFCYLWRALAILALLAVATVAFAQEQLPPGHSHVYTGQALIMTLPDGRIAVALGTPKETDTLTEHLFIFQPATAKQTPFFFIPEAEARYFHDHLVLLSGTERYVFSLRPEPKRERGEPRDGTYGGIGLAHYEGMAALGLNETELSAYLAAELADRRGIAPDSFDPHNQKPPGGGGGGTNCPAACSYTCQHGVAQASCSPSPPWCALCNCRLDGSPIAYCYQS